MARRKQIGVWVLLNSGGPWCISTHRDLDEAMKDARAILLARAACVAGPLFIDASRVWIAPSPQAGAGRK